MKLLHVLLVRWRMSRLREEHRQHLLHRFHEDRVTERESQQPTYYNAW